MPKYIGVMIDEAMLSEIEEVKSKMGLRNTSEVFRYILRRGIDVIKNEVKSSG